jgi:hypothetical protein
MRGWELTEGMTLLGVILVVYMCLICWFIALADQANG